MKEELTARDGDEEEDETANHGGGATRKDVIGEHQHGKAKDSENAKITNPPSVGVEGVRAKVRGAHGFDRSSRTQDETLRMVYPLPDSGIILLFRRPSSDDLRVAAISAHLPAVVPHFATDLPLVRRTPRLKGPRIASVLSSRRLCDVLHLVGEVATRSGWR